MTSRVMTGAVLVRRVTVWVGGGMGWRVAGDHTGWAGRGGVRGFWDGGDSEVSRPLCMRELAVMQALTAPRGVGGVRGVYRDSSFAMHPEREARSRSAVKTVTTHI